MNRRALESKVSEQCLAGAVLLSVAACGSPDVTTLSDTGPSPTVEVDPRDEYAAAEVERALAAHRDEIERVLAEAERVYGHMSESQAEDALAGAPLPSVEVLESERRALAGAALSATERAAIVSLLAATSGSDETPAFQGRLVLHGDLLHVADDLLARGRFSAVQRSAVVSKANVPLTFAAVDPTGMEPGGPPRPDQIAKVEDGQLLFWRPDLGRPYFIVAPDDLPDLVFYGILLASRALEGALQDDCIQQNLTVIHQHKYATLPPMARALSSVIEVAYSATACLDRADGCANSPRLAELAITPEASELRMRLGTYIGLEPDFDSPRDADTLPDLTDAKVRDVVLHELSHLLGFSHPRYTELEADIDDNVARVPQSSQGTVPTFMYPTETLLYSRSPSAEDKRALRCVYGQECGYRSEFRVLGEVCTAPAEALCLVHGGSCEVGVTNEGARLERCRWHDFTDAESCLRYSAGRWETSNDDAPATLFDGESGACIALASSLPSCIDQSFIRSDEALAGRCCTQFGTGARGLLFEAFAEDSRSYFCSDQRGLGEPVSGSWEFANAAEQSVFTSFDATTGTSSPGWTISSGDFVQELELPSHLIVSNRRLRSGCLTTRVTSDDDGESGIVFNVRNAQNYYVFDVLPNVRRRIRQVAGGVSTDLLVTPWSGATAWPSTTLTVCFGDGIHTFIDGRLSTRASVDGAVSFVGTGGRIGLWNDMNRGARHAYLRSRSLVEGYAELE